MKIKRIGKKLIICIFLFLIIFNFVVASTINLNVSYAESDGSGLLTGLAGIIQNFIKSTLLGIAQSIQSVEYALFSSGGSTGSTGITEAEELSIYHIFFNEFALTNINIFQTDDVDSDGFIYNIRMSAAGLFLIFDVIAFIFLLIKFIKIGMSLGVNGLKSNNPQGRGTLKEALMDLVVSVVLVLFMNMVVVAVINLNNEFVNILKSLAETTNSSEFMTTLAETALSDGASFALAIACILIYFLLIVSTAYYGVLYIIRFLLVSIMIIISPIMAIFYSNEKSKGGGSQILNKWFKEFCSLVFIQLIDCLIYVAIIAIPMATLDSATADWEGLGAALLCVIAILCIKPLENLLKDIFGLNRSRLINSSQTILNNTTKVVSSGVKIAAPVATKATGAVVSATGTVASAAGGKALKGVKFVHDGIRNNTPLGGIKDKVKDTAVGVWNGAKDVAEGIRTGRYSKYGAENATDDEEEAREKLDNAVESTNQEQNSGQNQNLR